MSGVLAGVLAGVMIFGAAVAFIAAWFYGHARAAGQRHAARTTQDSVLQWASLAPLLLSVLTVGGASAWLVWHAPVPDWLRGVGAVVALLIVIPVLLSLTSRVANDAEARRKRRDSLPIYRAAGATGALRPTPVTRFSGPSGPDNRQLAPPQPGVRQPYPQRSPTYGASSYNEEWLLAADRKPSPSAPGSSATPAPPMSADDPAGMPPSDPGRPPVPDDPFAADPYPVDPYAVEPRTTARTGGPEAPPAPPQSVDMRSVTETSHPGSSASLDRPVDPFAHNVPAVAQTPWAPPPPEGAYSDTGDPATDHTDGDELIWLEAGDIPDASQLPGLIRPGWVYQDADGEWFLGIVGDQEQHAPHPLVRLPAFTSTASDDPRYPLTVRGAVELSVLPLDGEDEPESADTGQ